MQALSVDALAPREVAEKAELVGVTKVGMSAVDTFVLSVIAGAFIAVGAIFATTVTAGGSALPYGVSRLLGGLAFSLGLILVVVAGAELFTGNNLIVMAWASRKVSTARLLRNWTLVYAGNFAGAIATAGILFVSKQYTFGNGAVGEQALAIATSKTGLGFVQAIVLGALCNALVCLAVWLAYGARSTADKILAIVPPIAAFVAAGFEHSVANMFFIPIGLFVKSDTAFASLHAPAGIEHLTWGHFFVSNLLPVTIGNVVGGAVMVGAIYWFVYLRGKETSDDDTGGNQRLRPRGARGAPSGVRVLSSSLEFVAINDVADSQTLAQLLAHDSVYGEFPGTSAAPRAHRASTRREIPFFGETDPAALPWAELGVDVVLECTGRFKTREAASKHLAAGARKVIVSAPAKDADVTVVLGVNFDAPTTPSGTRSSRMRRARPTASRRSRRCCTRRSGSATA